MRAKQQDFFDTPTFKHLTRKEHGGGLYRGQRKEARPIATSQPIHLTLKSKRAHGEWAMDHPLHNERVFSLVNKIARKNFVKIHRFANASDHLHLLVEVKRRRHFKKFLRTVAAMVARAVTGAKKGAPKGKFWSSLAYSRVVTWGREFNAVSTYIDRNSLETLGLLTRALRKYSLSDALAMAQRHGTRSAHLFSG
jgi:REP element-mobilizing transposase RayT